MRVQALSRPMHRWQVSAEAQVTQTCVLPKRRGPGVVTEMPTSESVIRRYPLLSAVIISVSAGCAQLSPPTPSSPGSTDMVAILTVVEDVYAAQGRGRMIFLGTYDNSIDEAQLRQARMHLQTDLEVTVKDASEADLSDPTLPVRPYCDGS